MVDPTFFTVNLKLYRLDDDRKDWIPFLDLVQGHPNSGDIEFSLSLSDKIGSSVYPVALRISVGGPAPMGDQDDGIFALLQRAIQSAQDIVSQWFSTFFYYAIDSLNLFQKCLEWYLNEPSNIGEVLLSRVPDCCQTAERAAAPNSGFVRDTHDTLVAFFHPGADSCYRQATINRLDNTHAHCYTMLI